MARLSTDGNTILDNYDRFTGVPFNATKVTKWWDGSDMDDSKVDNAIYFKNTASLGGGYSKRDYEGDVDVRWFGVLGDGSNNSAEMQYALEVVPPGTTFFFPYGVYEINDVILPSNVTLTGLGVILGKTIEGTDVVNKIFDTPEDNDITEITISGLTFDGNRVGVNSDAQNEMLPVVCLRNIESAIVDNCKFKNFCISTTGDQPLAFRERENAILVLKGCFNNTVTNCELFNNSKGEQVWITPADNGVFFIDNNYSHDHVNPFSIFNVIHASGVFSNNRLYNGMQSACNLLVYDSVIENNVVDGVSNSFGIDLAESGIYATSNVTVRNNIIKNCASGGLTVCGNNTIIEGNTIENCRYNIRAQMGWKAEWIVYGDFTNTTPRDYTGLYISQNTFGTPELQSIFINAVEDYDSLGETARGIGDIYINDNKIYNDPDVSLANILAINVRNINIFSNDIRGWGITTSYSSRPSIIIEKKAIGINIEFNKFSDGVTANPLILAVPVDNEAYKDMNLSYNTFPATASVTAFRTAGFVRIISNENLAESSVILYGKPNDYEFKLFNPRKITYNTVVPIYGKYQVSDIVIKSNRNQSDSLGWYVTTAGCASAGASVRNDFVSQNDSWTYSDGSVWECVLNGTTDATTQPDVSGKVVGDTIVDGTATMRKGSNVAAVFSEMYTLLRNNGTPEGVQTVSGTGVYLRKDGGIGSTLYIREVNAAGNNGWRPVQGIHSGTTANRPTVTTTGYLYFDTTLQQYITWNGSVWLVGVIIDSGSTPHTKSTINAAYPNARIGNMVIQDVAGQTYIKKDNSSTGDWSVFPTVQLT